MAYMIVQREITLSQGDRYKFKVAPVDPHDVFRGRYVTVDIEGDGPFVTDTRLHRGMNLYPSLVVDKSGIASLTNPAVKPPKDAPYMKVKCSYCNVAMRESGIVTTNFYKQADGVVKTNTYPKMVATGKYKTSVELPFDRYYIDEKLAPKAEQVYNDSRRSGEGKQDAALFVRVYKGRALIETLEIGGVSIRDLAKEAK
jgi:uncharacterized membrane-anchored protein